ncbi:hypothetical protein NAT51_00910 [Flavobacterium amniphilum]|uniref:hypothetical protein n=1 Tax=Flavobacterium amniphilum TaxID=1834035 RepID=UPI002029C753|nr:hypothetical protein [Flavobacterium amniphilum]MCL9804064.1 hypothetical protein [Flavobacterium amniphilum]
MKMLRLFLILIFSLGCSPKLPTQETVKFPVKIIEVYYQKWVAGVQGGGSGINFHMEFSEELPKDIVLNQLYFRERKDSVRMIDKKNYEVALLGTINWKQENDADDAVKTKTMKAPISISENEAVLEFTQNGKRKLFKIKSITEKEMLAYPSARPRN